MRTPHFISLRYRGESIVPFEVARAFQVALRDQRERDDIPDTFIFVEHPPVITRGRGLQRKPGEARLAAMPMGALPEGTEYFEVERGGDLTWHGPGQLVVYPIVKLDGSGFGPERDIGGYLRSLERVFGHWFTVQGLKTEGSDGATGIWVLRGTEPARKIASIGIAVRKWVTTHGIGINLANSLEGFSFIAPCGFSPEVMTTLQREKSEFAREGFTGAVREECERGISREVLASLGIGTDPDVSVTEIGTHPSI